MYTGHTYPLGATLKWSATGLIAPLLWSALVTAAFVHLDLQWVAIPWLPMSLIGIAVAFYLGFKNNASYDRTWEARKIWGAIVNASRSWAFSARDFVGSGPTKLEEPELDEIRVSLVHRHIAWMDALRYQLRQIKSWEHDSPKEQETRRALGAPEYSENLIEQLRRNLPEGEVADVVKQINPAAHLLSNQSRELSVLFAGGVITAYHHVELQRLLVELMAQQGKAERIKNFPFPRQYATVNAYFAKLLIALLPFGLLPEFAQVAAALDVAHASLMIWLTVPFSGVVSWVFLTTNKIGDWSENPFEGLHNDVPISSMARGIERDMRQMIGETELPPPREAKNGVAM